MRVAGAAIAALLAVCAVCAVAAPGARASQTQIYPEAGGTTLIEPGGHRVHLGPKATADVRDAVAALTVDTGATGQSGAALMPEAPSISVKVAEHVAEGVEDGKYAETYERGAYSFEADLQAADEAAGTLPAAAGIFDALPPVALAAGTFYLGYEIGSSVKGLFGLGGEAEEIKAGALVGTVELVPYTKSFVADAQGEEGGLGGEPVYQSRGVFPVTFPADGVAFYRHSNSGYDLNTTQGNLFIGSMTYGPHGDRCDESAGNINPGEFGLPPNGAVLTAPVGPIYQSCGYEGEHQWSKDYDVGAYLGTSGLRAAQERGYRHAGWPGPKTSLEGAVHTVKVPAPAPLASPVKGAEIDTEQSPGGARVETVPPKVTEHIVREFDTEVQKEKDVETEREVEGNPQEPLAPELPAPRPTETGTEYKTELVTDGWTKVNLRTLTESQEDPAVGPEGVAYTVPGSGAHVSYSTEVTVEQNPASAAAPSEGGVSVPALPAVQLPSVPNPCNVFPFGVPCWLASQVESWATTAKAPEFTLTLPFGIRWVFNGSVCEPFMEIIRPVEVVLTAIGIVLLMGRFSSSSSGGGDEG